MREAPCRTIPTGSSPRSGLHHEFSAIICPLLDAAANDPVFADQILRRPRPTAGRWLTCLLGAAPTTWSPR